MEQRSWKGMSYLVAYTYSKSLERRRRLTRVPSGRIHTPPGDGERTFRLRRAESLFRGVEYSLALWPRASDRQPVEWIC